MKNLKLSTFCLLSMLLLLMAFSPTPSVAGKLPPGFVEVEVAGELDPTDFAIASDGRIFIVEKKGTIRLIRDGKLLDAPFMELAVDNDNERGLQSIELDPNFETNNFFYVFYSVPVRNFNRVSRFTANGDLVLPGSEKVLFEMDPTIGTVHNGGGMIISQDEKLIFAAGDGNASWRSQWDWQTHGKVMRINLDGSIPDDNPKTFGGQKYEAVVARGMRNPFGMTQAPDGRIFINDVGGTLFEEINELEFGANYGWPYLEGILTNQSPPPDYKDPIFAYDHNFGCAIVGGVFVDPNHPLYPDQYKGKYLFSDYCQGFIQVFDPITEQITEVFATDIDRPLRMNFDLEGNLFYLERAGLGGGSIGDNTQSTEGRLMKIIFTGDGKPVISRSPRNLLLSVGETGTFSVSANGADPLNYEWFIDNTSVQNGSSNILEVTDVQLIQNGAEVNVIVSNNDGSDTSNVAVLMVTDNSRPVPSITLKSSSLYTAGSEITVEGVGMDSEDGTLGASQMTWTVDFHHDLHTHPAVGATNNTQELTFAVPESGEIDDNVWFRVYLNVVDSEGLSAITFLDVFPEKTTFRVESEPSDLLVNIDGLNSPTPIDVQSVVGLDRSLGVSEFVFGEDRAFLFQQWENGDPSSVRNFIAQSQNQVFKAEYRVLNYGSGTGLIGDYFDMENDLWEFPEDPIFTRLDSLIDFTWYESADSVRLGEDKWLIRWQGEIQPLVDGQHAFGFNARSGARIFVDNRLMLEEWEDKATEFYESDSIYLEANEKYEIVIEFFTTGSVGAAQFYWANQFHGMTLVPTSQLYPQRVSTTDTNTQFLAEINPNPFRSNPTLRVEDRTGDVEYSIYNQMGQEVYSKKLISLSGKLTVTLPLEDFPSGTYFVKVINVIEESRIIKLVKY